MKEDRKGSNWGGRREGAGRPASGKPAPKTYSFRLGGKLSDVLDAQPDKSGFIRDCISNAVEGTPDFSALGTACPATDATSLELPYFGIRIAAGFPIPLDNDEKAQEIDVLKMLCPDPESCYLIRVQGDSMIDADIFSGDVVIVDKSRRDPDGKDVAVCEFNGEYTVKHFVRQDGEGWLVPANPAYPKIRITPEDEFKVWGTVTYVIHRPRTTH